MHRKRAAVQTSLSSTHFLDSGSFDSVCLVCWMIRQLIRMQQVITLLLLSRSHGAPLLSRRIQEFTPTRCRFRWCYHLPMRVYKFLDAHFGLKSLYEKRLKISRLDELNDPFEFLPFELRNQKQRWAARATAQELGEKHGILCFSSCWTDPVIWAHYSDKHKGLCLGFEIPGDSQITRAVEYVSERLPFPDPPTLADSYAMLFTKFKHWAYEQEIRVWVQLNDKEEVCFIQTSVTRSNSWK